jgi:hypothetical protein
MPPQQSERLLDVFDNGRDFRAHDALFPLGHLMTYAAHCKFCARSANGLNVYQ